MIVKGIVKRVGAGTWRAGGSGTSTRHSVIEIGDASIRGVTVPEYIGTYLVPGADVEALIVRPVGVKSMQAIKCDGKVHRDTGGQVTLGIFSIILGLPALFALLNSAVGWALILVLVPLPFAWSLYSILTFK